MSELPAYGHTADGRPVHARAHHYMGDVIAHFSPAAISRDVRAVKGINAKLAVLLTRVVGTMWCFFAFNLIALPAVISALGTGSLLPIINAISSNWLQLILLPGIMVGQAVIQVSADRRTAKMFEHVESLRGDMHTALDRLDDRTAGGLGAVMVRLDQIEARLPR